MYLNIGTLIMARYEIACILLHHPTHSRARWVLCWCTDPGSKVEWNVWQRGVIWSLLPQDGCQLEDYLWILHLPHKCIQTVQLSIQQVQLHVAGLHILPASGSGDYGSHWVHHKCNERVWPSFSSIVLDLSPKPHDKVVGAKGIYFSSSQW